MSQPILDVSNQNEIQLPPAILKPRQKTYSHIDCWWEKEDFTRTALSREAYLTIKRILDVLIIVLTLPLTLPVMLTCALLIKITSPGGPFLFLQERTGKGGIRFKMYKFRTMVPNAEAMKSQLAHLNELTWPDFKITNDPRITRVGKFLRKTSLDELPQILNILKGQMSIVGPRPTSFSPYTYHLWHTERLDVLPGLTGLWQIIGRCTMEFDERVRLDVAYIQYRSLWVDLQIMFLTVIAVLQHRGAH